MSIIEAPASVIEALKRGDDITPEMSAKMKDYVRGTYPALLPLFDSTVKRYNAVNRNLRKGMAEIILSKLPKPKPQEG